MEILYESILELFKGDGWEYVVMWLIGGLLIFLAIKKDGIAVLFYCGYLFICKPCCQLRREVLR